MKNTFITLRTMAKDMKIKNVTGERELYSKKEFANIAIYGVVAEP